jgi:NAD(P)-dependent dehydrogenase (short-subunit alcohol dehydrogenase family)
VALDAKKGAGASDTDTREWIPMPGRVEDKFRLITEDVADTVLFLVSDESKYVTAHEIAPDAGVTEF